MLCARKPTVREEKARFDEEKNSTVRAFCTETSQLNRVVSGEVQYDPRITGGELDSLGLFTTDIKVCAGWPRGRRIPARVARARAAAAAMIFVTSFAVSRAAPFGKGRLDGSSAIEIRNSPVVPPRLTWG